MADYVLVEADGSHGLPLKAPNEKEPYLLGGESLVIAMAGMSGLQRPIAEAAHRAERYAALVHKTPLDTATSRRMWRRFWKATTVCING